MKNNKKIALKFCREWNSKKKNNGLTKLKKEIDNHFDFCSTLLKELKTKKLSEVIEDLEDAILVYKIDGVR